MNGSILEQLARNDEGVITRRCHARGGMASSQGRPVIVEGGGGPSGTEILDIAALEWMPDTAQPYHR